MKVHWVNIASNKSKEKLQELQQKLSNYYSNSKFYYDEIDADFEVWKDQSHLPLKAIINQAHLASKILEVGCGQAKILRAYPSLQDKYTGIEFSSSILDKNKVDYPGAQFSIIENPDVLPFGDSSFDLVFSVFVLEHVVRPDLFLSENIRVLKPGGVLMILCPDYFGHYWMASQRYCKEPFSGSFEKLKKGNIVDLIRFQINYRFILPFLMRFKFKNKGFWINLSPICFQEDCFRPDVDAVFVTSKSTIEEYIQSYTKIENQNPSFVRFIKDRRLIFINCKKNG